MMVVTGIPLIPVFDMDRVANQSGKWDLAGVVAVSPCAAFGGDMQGGGVQAASDKICVV